MKVNLLFRRVPKGLAQDSGDYPIPVADAAEILPEPSADMPLTSDRELTVRGQIPNGGHLIDLADDPSSYCCERCEHLTGLIREAGGVKAMADHLIAGFEQQLEAIHR